MFTVVMVFEVLLMLRLFHRRLESLDADSSRVLFQQRNDPAART